MLVLMLMLYLGENTVDMFLIEFRERVNQSYLVDSWEASSRNLGRAKTTLYFGIRREAFSICIYSLADS